MDISPRIIATIETLLADDLALIGAESVSRVRQALTSLPLGDALAALAAETSIALARMDSDDEARACHAMVRAALRRAFDDDALIVTQRRFRDQQAQTLRPLAGSTLARVIGAATTVARMRKTPADAIRADFADFAYDPAIAVDVAKTEGRLSEDDVVARFAARAAQEGYVIVRATPQNDSAGMRIPVFGLPRREGRVFFGQLICVGVNARTQDAPPRCARVMRNALLRYALATTTPIAVETIPPANDARVTYVAEAPIIERLKDGALAMRGEAALLRDNAGVWRDLRSIFR